MLPVHLTVINYKIFGINKSASNWCTQALVTSWYKITQITAPE